MVIVSGRRITGLSADVIAELVAEVGPLWQERHQTRSEARPRKRAIGAGVKHRPASPTGSPPTLTHPRHGATHEMPAPWLRVDLHNHPSHRRGTGPCPPGETAGIRLHTPAEAIDHPGTDEQTRNTDGTDVTDVTEIRTRRPATGRKRQDKHTSGKNKQNPPRPHSSPTPAAAPTPPTPDNQARSNT
ncbi:hypothetical protein [Streptomyces sp. NPDC088748]|uniref:hypothetical protein n=1 Tax=Streptomyces sp. NPDC088748 TaxID=3365887 RepID=UPI0037F37FF9